MNHVYEWGGTFATDVSMAGSTAFWCVTCCAALLYPQQRLERVERAYLALLTFGLGTPDVYVILTRETYNDLPEYGGFVAVVGIAFVLVLVARYRRYKGVQRRTLAPVLVTTSAVALAGAIGWFVLLSNGIFTPQADQPVIDITYCVQGTLLLAFAPTGFIIGGLRRRFLQAAVADSLARLPQGATPEEVREALRAALRDDRLDVLYWSLEHDAYVDARGHLVSPPVASVEQTVISIRAGSRFPLALLVADRALDSEAVLFGDAVSAPKEPVVKAWLQARDRAYQEQQHALQRRLEEERWNERRRLGRDLHDGVQQHLYALGTCLAVAREQACDHPVGVTIEGACRQLTDLLPSFRAMIHGLAPPELAQYGLGPALHALIEQQTIPTEAHITRERAPVAIEYIAYLIVCEAMTNVTKHAGAGRIVLTTELRENNLMIEVADDGKGGADVSRGTGIAGLRDRARSVGGHLEVHSPRRRGDHTDSEDSMRVAVADDNRLFREGLVLLLEKIGVNVIAQAADGEGIIRVVEEDVPDVVILDIVMPPGDRGGLAAAECLHEKHPDAGLLLLSGYDSTQFALRLFACDGAGGRGYLIKDRVTSPRTLRDTLRSIDSGAMSVDPEIAKRLINPKSHKSPLDDLSTREVEVLELVAQGCSNKDIAERLRLSPKTVDRHVSNICNKFDIPDSEEKTRRSLILLKYFQAMHICDARCATPCRFAVPGDQKSLRQTGS